MKLHLSLIAIVLLTLLPKAQAHRSQVWLKLDVPAAQELQAVEIRLPVYLETVEQQVQSEIEARRALTFAGRGSFKTNDDPVLNAVAVEARPKEELENEIELLRADLRLLAKIKASGRWNASLSLAATSETAFSLTEARAVTAQAQIAEMNILSERMKKNLRPETRAWFEKVASELSVRVVTKDVAGQTMRFAARADLPSYTWKDRDQFLGKLHQTLELQRSRRDDDKVFRASLLRTDKPEPKDWNTGVNPNP